MDQITEHASRDKDTLLNLLAELGQQFADAEDIGASLRAAVTESMRYLSAEAGSIFLVSEEGEQVECVACGGPVDISGLRMSAEEGIVGQVIRDRTCHLIRDARHDTAFFQGVDQETGFETRSVLCAPLIVRGNLLGVLELLNKASNDGLFDDADCHFLSVVASGVALALQNARQATQMVERERIRHELTLARKIQASLLPKPQGPEFPFHGINLSAREVSGDFYHFQPLENGQYLFALGDVAGKGVYAALLVSRITTLIQAFSHMLPTPGALMARLNEELMASGSSGVFVTLALGIYQPDSGRVRLANAGHLPPLLRDAAGHYDQWPARCPPLGVLDGVTFGEAGINVGRGTLFLYTDGLTESLADSPEDTGIDDLCRLIDRYAWVLPDQRTHAVVQAATEGSDTRKDDVTFLYLDGAAGDIRLLAEQEFSTTPDQLCEVRQLVSETLQDTGLTEESLTQTVLAIGEGAMNIVQHGFKGGDNNGTMTVSLFRQASGITLRLSDNAPFFDPGTVQPRAAARLKPGGLGLGLIRDLMDGVIYLPRSDALGNVLEMYKGFGGEN
ncbi:MAG: SpoIIE family protein phosphatase [Pseudomonadota bacterium]